MSLIYEYLLYIYICTYTYDNKYCTYLCIMYSHVLCTSYLSVSSASRRPFISDTNTDSGGGSFCQTKSNSVILFYTHQNNWAPKNGFQRILVPVGYCKTVKTGPSTVNVFSKWDYILLCACMYVQVCTFLKTFACKHLLVTNVCKYMYMYACVPIRNLQLVIKNTCWSVDS